MILKKETKEGGITLIALAVTIVVLLILAGVSLNAVFGEKGIIKYASSSGEKLQMQAIREQVETVKLDWEMNKKIDKNTTVSDFFKALETAGIIDSAEENVKQEKTEQKDGYTETDYTITTKDGYDINITLKTTEDGKTEITITEVVSNANALPRVEITSLEATTNSITVKVDVRRQTGKLIYSYRVVGTSDYTTAAETEDTTVEITALKTNTVYEIKVEASNKNGTSFDVQGATTGELASGTIEFGDQVWNDGTATIKLQTTSSYQMQYQIGATEENGWILYNQETGITGLQHSQTVYARIFDGVNGSEEASISILDDVVPTVTISSNITKTTKSITVSVTSSDSESGMPSAPVYYFYIKKSTESEFKTDSTGMVNGVGANTATSYTFNNLEDGISYDVKVTVFDNAKNEGTATKTGITTDKITGASDDLKEGSIIASTPTWSNGTASINLSTDTGLTIQYQIGSISESGWQNYNSSTGITGLSHNTTVYARLTDGQNNGDEASITILDGVNPTAKITAITAYNITSGTTTTITATVTQTDNESGINTSNCKYVFNNSNATLGTNASSYTDGTFSSTSQSVSKTVGRGSWYLHVLTVDNAGNAIETISNAINVTQKVTLIRLNKTTAEMYTDDTLTLTATVTPDNANTKTVNWSSSNTSIATVNSNGLVTAISAGNVTITATAADGSGKTASCSITVKNPLPYLTNSEFTSSNRTTTTSETVKVQDLLGNQVVIPGGFGISTDSGTTVKEGIVIEDAEGNQFVWVPVSNINADGSNKIKVDENTEVEITLGRYTFDTTDGTPILQQAGENYTSTISLTSDAGRTYQELSTYRESNQVSGTSGTNTTAKDLQAFIKKTAENKGYYIARYEASYGSGSSTKDWKPLSKVSTETRTGSSTTLTTGMLWNCITQGNAAKVCQNMYSGNSYVESDLTNSYAWDTAIVYIQAMGNSNYANQIDGNCTLKNTGETGDEKCKIFDMAGNEYEWTTEFGTYTDDGNTFPCCCRGANFRAFFPTANRGNWSAVRCDMIFSFRVSIYVK